MLGYWPIPWATHKLTMTFYRWAIRPWLFLADPEWIHDRSIRLAEWAGSHPGLCSLIAQPSPPDPRLTVEWGGSAACSKIRI